MQSNLQREGRGTSAQATSTCAAFATFRAKRQAPKPPRGSMRTARLPTKAGEQSQRTRAGLQRRRRQEDVRLFHGVVEADESELTGESLPIEKSAGATAYAGSRIKRGEASGEVTATGQYTYFGKSAELVKTAKTASHLQKITCAIVKYLVTRPKRLSPKM